MNVTVSEARTVRMGSQGDWALLGSPETSVERSRRPSRSASKSESPRRVTVVRMFMPTCEPAGPLPARVEAGDPGTDSATLGRLSLAGGARSLDARPIARWEIVRLSFPSF